jgi:DNA-binding transcriptional ArsR family regulator
MAAEEAEAVADLMSALSAGSRVRLLYSLLVSGRTVAELAEDTGLSAGAVSQQLRVLRLYGLVEGQRDGRHVRYRLGHHVAEFLTEVRAHTDHVRIADDNAGPVLRERRGSASRRAGGRPR